MAVTSFATDWRIKITALTGTNLLGLGPLDSVPANAVLLTQENLQQAGAHAPRVSNDWDCELRFYLTVDGAETATTLDGTSIAGTYWDPIARVANTLTVALDGDQVTYPGVFNVSFADTDTTVAGMYSFTIVLTEALGDTYDLCSGKLEILPAIPS